MGNAEARLTFSLTLIVGEKALMLFQGVVQGNSLNTVEDKSIELFLSKCQA